MLELYHKTQCPFSAKVRNYIDEHGLKNQIEYHETESEPGAKDRLRELTGHTQVPVLVVDGKPMPESDEIIEWLDQHLSNNYLADK